MKPLTQPIALALKYYAAKLQNDWGNSEWRKAHKLTPSEKAAGCTAAVGDTALFRQLMASCDVEFKKKDPTLEDLQAAYLQAVANAKASG